MFQRSSLIMLFTSMNNIFKMFINMNWHISLHVISHIVPSSGMSSGVLTISALSQRDSWIWSDECSKFSNLSIFGMKDSPPTYPILHIVPRYMGIHTHLFYFSYTLSMYVSIPCVHNFASLYAGIHPPLCVNIFLEWIECVLIHEVSPLLQKSSPW